MWQVVAVNDRVIDKEALVGRRLLCGKLHATGNLGRFGQFFLELTTVDARACV